MLPGGKEVDPLAAQVPQPALDQVAGDGRADRLGDHEADTRGRPERLRAVPDSSRPRGGPPSGDRRGDGRGVRPRGSERARSGGCWRRARPAAQPRLRRRGGCGPCDGGEDRIARPARVRMRRRKPWVLCRRRLFGWNVRLLNVFTPLEGAGYDSRGHRVGSSETQSPVVGQLAPLAHETTGEDGLSWTCGTGRRRCDLPTVRGARGQGQFGDPRTARVPGAGLTQPSACPARDTPQAWGQLGRTCGQPVDPQAPESR